MQWSQLRKRIESLFANSVRARVQIGSTGYGAEQGRGWIRVDGNEILTTTWTYDDHSYYPEEAAEAEARREAIARLHARNLFSRQEWHRALFHYLNMSIEEILRAESPLIRALGMLDARLGKRRLGTLEVAREHELVQKLYRLRCDAEGLDLCAGLSAGVQPTARLKRRLPPERDSIDQSRRERAVRKLGHAKATRDVARLISALSRGTLSPEDMDTEISREIARAFAESVDPSLLIETLQLLQDKTKLLEDARYVRGILALTHDAAQWSRPLDTWHCRSHNPRRQFSSLARHLFAEYDVPVFLDDAWLRGTAVQQEWFKHVGRGVNIRTAPGLPIPLTKKMAHHFLGAPDGYSIDAAFLWGQIHALGGGGRLADALRETRIVGDFHDPEFRLSVLRFFIRNPMLDPVHIGPIVDYIWHEKYENRIVFEDRGVARETGPAQPNFTMAGRTAPSLLRQVDTWHRQLGRESAAGDVAWRHSLIEDYQFVEGTQEARNMKVWRIRELLSSRELAAEGRQQRHCVATYAQSCAMGRCSIWTMDVETEAGTEKCVTIELRNTDRTVWQVRGRRNRFPTEKEKEILQRWATREGLRLAARFV